MMAEDQGAWAAGLLVDQAEAATAEGRYQEAVAAACRAVEAAEQLDDPVLLVRALGAEAEALMMLGNHPAALARYTRVLGLTEDPATRGRLEGSRADQVAARAHWRWVECSQFVTGIPLRELFGVLDAAERWLTATGHRDWRAAILAQRAQLHDRLGESDAALAAAQEALAVATQHPGTTHYSLGTYRYWLGEILLDAGRGAEAAPHYQDILNDPAANQWDRRVAHKGLAQCALDAGDQVAARREARTAVLLAESLSDHALCPSLAVLAEACRADGDLEQAWQTATRGLEAARRVGGHLRPYHAALTAVDIALDRGDLATAKQLVGELDEHAAALDASDGTSTRTRETAKRHQRLAEQGLTQASAPAGHPGPPPAKLSP